MNGSDDPAADGSGSGEQPNDVVPAAAAGSRYGSRPDNGGIGPSSAELLAAAYLSRVAEPASVALWLLVCQLGYLEAAAAVRAGDVPAEVAACTEARRESADAELDLAAAERNGIRLLMPSSPQWPHFAFASMEHAARRRAAVWLTGRRTRPPRGELIPPLALWVRGDAELSGIGVHAVAIIGARAATGYGEHIARDFAYGLARRDVVVVSGGAYGIDAAAHQGALAADGITVLVSAGGLDRPYPAGHAGLYERVAETGLLISERPPGSAPHRQRFLSRNRIIAALGTATLVVEAGQRSGALNSAGYARDLGRPVLAVPGPITSALSLGCHRLLQRDEQPARLVTSVADVLEYCGSSMASAVGTALASSPTSLLAEPAADLDRAGRIDLLDEVGRAVLDGFPARRSVTEADLARVSGQPVRQVLAALPVLVRLGLVDALREGYRLTGVGTGR